MDGHRCAGVRFWPGSTRAQRTAAGDRLPHRLSMAEVAKNSTVAEPHRLAAARLTGGG
jgi:hypothetical protein